MRYLMAAVLVVGLFVTYKLSFSPKSPNVAEPAQIYREVEEQIQATILQTLSAKGIETSRVTFRKIFSDIKEPLKKMTVHYSLDVGPAPNESSSVVSYEGEVDLTSTNAGLEWATQDWRGQNPLLEFTDPIEIKSSK